MATTNKDLFGDESSDEDESPQQKHVSVAPPPPASESPSKRVIQEDFDDDSSDEPDDDRGEAAAPPKKKKAHDRKEENDTEMTNQELTKRTAAGEDEDDVEFDDGGVVGSSAPPPTRESTEAMTRSSKRPSKKPRHIEVLESQRPPPGTSLHMTKLPNLVGIQPEAFDPNTYSASLEEQDYRGFVHSMIRWRYVRTKSGELKRDEHGKLMRESNARLVAWDDGSGGPKSYTLHVGTEVLEVDTNHSSSNGFAGLNGYLYLSQKATLADDDHTLAGTVLESMGAIQSRFIPRPSSLESAAHKSLTVAVRQKTIKTARIAEYVTQEDPEKLKLQNIKIKDDLEKASARKKQSYSNNRRSAPPAMNRRYLEQEEDDGMYDTINIKDMKRGKDYEEMDYGEDSEDDDEDEEDNTMFNRRKPARGRAARAASRSRRETVEKDGDDDEDELVFEEESDDDEIKATSKKKIQHQALVDDDDDD